MSYEVPAHRWNCDCDTCFSVCGICGEPEHATGVTCFAWHSQACRRCTAEPDCETGWRVLALQQEREAESADETAHRRAVRALRYALTDLRLARGALACLPANAVANLASAAHQLGACAQGPERGTWTRAMRVYWKISAEVVAAVKAETEIAQRCREISCDSCEGLPSERLR